MDQDGTLYEIDRERNREEIASVFRALATAFESGRTVALAGDGEAETLSFDPPDRAAVELEFELEPVEGEEDGGDGAGAGDDTDGDRGEGEADAGDDGGEESPAGRSTAEFELELEWTVDASPDSIAGGTNGGASGSDAGIVVGSDSVDDGAIPLPTAGRGQGGSAGPAGSDDSSTADASTDESSREDGRRSRFEVYRDAAGEYRWRLVHWNGNVIADGGEGYASRRNAVDGLESVIRNAPSARVDHLDEGPDTRD